MRYKEIDINIKAIPDAEDEAILKVNKRLIGVDGFIGIPGE